MSGPSAIFYFYGAVLFGTRYILLFDESVLDQVKSSLKSGGGNGNISDSRSSSPHACTTAHAFVAAEPGSTKPPGFEAAAAALQRYLGGSVINIRGSFGLEILPVIISLRNESKTCEIIRQVNDIPTALLNSTDGTDGVKRGWKGDSLIGVYSKLYILQSWRQGQFGQYFTPNWPKHKSTADTLLASAMNNTRIVSKESEKPSQQSP